MKLFSLKKSCFICGHCGYKLASELYITTGIENCTRCNCNMEITKDKMRIVEVVVNITSNFKLNPFYIQTRVYPAMLLRSVDYKELCLKYRKTREKMYKMKYLSTKKIIHRGACRMILMQLRALADNCIKEHYVVFVKESGNLNKVVHNCIEKLRAKDELIRESDFKRLLERN